jgi:coatomer protein complex subunit gamma
MRSFFHPFLNLLILESYLRLVLITFSYMEDKHMSWLKHISCVVTFSSPFQSSAPVELTEAETEYSVNVVKHIYDGHIVLQYNCTNTIPEQLLEQV